MPEFSNYVESMTPADGTTGTILIPVSRNGDPESMTPAQVVAAGGGGGGGAVDSVNGQTGVVVLDAGDVGADPAGSAAAAQAASQPADSDLTAIAALSPANDDVLQRKAGAWTNRTIAQLLTDLAIPRVLVVACSDEVTPITAATNKIKFRMPYAMTLTAVRASLSTAQTSGSIFTVDINEGGTTILSTKLTIDNTETTSTTAATPPVISDSALADNAEISIDVDQVGDNTAKGLKVYLIGV